jgi:hypothetical protein
MPYITEYIAKDRGLIFRWTGTVSGQEIISSYHDRFAFLERNKNTRYVYVDYTDADNVAISSEEVRIITRLALETSRSDSNPHNICAVAVTPSDAMFGMVRMGQAYADDDMTGWRSYVARTRKEAEDWLRSQLGLDLSFKN